MQSVAEKVESVAGAAMDLLQGNPFGTLVGSRIEMATDPSLASENWALNMEICDFINDTDSGPKDAIRAIRKRLQNNMGKNHTVVMYTLTVLETCVKNCGRKFHVLVAQKDFVQELVKMIGPKFDPPQIVQEKVLGLIQSWTDAFRGVPELRGIVDVYEELKAKGVDFPMTDLDKMAPIETPARSHGETNAPRLQFVTDSIAPPPKSPPAATKQPAKPPAAAALHPHPPRPVQPQGPISLTPEQMSKLRSELDVVSGNMNVLREMLTELSPGSEAPEDYELLQELHKTCMTMQERLVNLLSVVADEEVTSHLLIINDEMNNVNEKYKRYMANRVQKTLESSATTPPAAVASKSAELIDFGSDKPPSTYEDNKGGADQAASLGSLVAHKSEHLGGGSGTPGQTTPSSKEPELTEVQDWFHKQGGGKDTPSSTSSAGGTTKEFDDFLAQRAAAAESIPTAPGGASGGGNRVKSKEEEEQRMFAL